MAARTRFTVRYGHYVARFSDYLDAMLFAEHQSRRHGTTAEVGNRYGLVGQYQNGKTTPEFAEHHKCRNQ